MKTTKGDKLLIILLSLFSLLVAYIFTGIGNRSQGNQYVSVMVDGQEYKKIEFSDEVIGKTYLIKTQFGRNVIEIGDNSVRVIEADCPDQLDVRQGTITKPGQVLVCLPNRLMVEIKASNDSNNEIDSFNY